MKTGSRIPASGFLSRVSHLVQVPLTAIRTSGTSPTVVYPLIFFRPPLFSYPVKKQRFHPYKMDGDFAICRYFIYI